MQTLLRHTPTRQYFQALGKWTPDSDEAHDFGMVARAVRFAHQTGFRDLELIVRFDSPDQVTDIPLERLRLRLTHAGKRGHQDAGAVSALSSHCKRLGQPAAHISRPAAMTR